MKNGRVTPQLMVASIMCFGVGLIGLAVVKVSFYVSRFFKRISEVGS